LRDRALVIKAERWKVLLGALVVYCLDALSKAYIIQRLDPGESIPLIPGIFHLTRLQNSGAAFSMFYEHPELLTFVASLLFAVFTWYMLTKKTLAASEMIGFSLVLGGALGNLMDRLQIGAVTDFLDFTLIRYPVFNLADSFIFAGVILLLIAYVNQYHHPSRS
jgi:signal peptidase II